MDRRRLWLDLDNTEYIRETLKFPGCQIALRVDRDVIAEDGTVRLSDTRYFLTSVAPESITADELLAAVRNHWQIENSVFFLKDRWWDEDRHWTRRPGLSQWLAYLTTAATIHEARITLRLIPAPQPLHLAVANPQQDRQPAPAGNSKRGQADCIVT